MPPSTRAHPRGVVGPVCGQGVIAADDRLEYGINPSSVKIVSLGACGLLVQTPIR